MDSLKKALITKLIFFILPPTLIISFIFIVVLVICGFEMGEGILNEYASQIHYDSYIKNNDLYAVKYKSLLNNYLVDKGYVSLERLVFYLQKTKNVLDTSKLSYEEWEQAYIDNLNLDEKKMIPIKLVCENVKENYIFDNPVTSGENDDGVSIDVIDLCNEDVLADDYSEIYLPFIYESPLKNEFTISSFVFENREIDLNVSEIVINRLNFHSGWDLVVPIGTDFYSICDGTIKNIVNTQNNDLSYNESKNDTGNYVEVTCDNGFIAQYHHIKYKSTPMELKEGTKIKIGDLLGKTSTTGLSEGAHLHLGLIDENGKRLDAFNYINFSI